MKGMLDPVYEKSNWSYRKYRPLKLRNRYHRRFLCIDGKIQRGCKARITRDKKQSLGVT